ncbi:MAG: hypothetical protein J0H09_04005 [Burkholderiales bacterium]|nr:hypothetical protein [Burkholderiales bacterium]
MASLSAEFEYLPVSINRSFGNITISDLPNRDETVRLVESRIGVRDGWIFAPTGSRVFGLRKTHQITHSRCDGSNHLEFIVWCLGFFMGIRLSTTECPFLDATPIRTGSLVDFELMRKKDLGAAVDLIENYWQTNKRKINRIDRMRAAIHALFLSQCKSALQFEKFHYSYVALDTCYAIARQQRAGRNKRISHGGRIKWACDQYGMQVPSWAHEVSGTRNRAAHEGLFLGEPLGFKNFGPKTAHSSVANLPREMGNLVCRLIVAQLGRKDCQYVQSPSDSIEYWFLSL